MTNAFLNSTKFKVLGKEYVLLAIILPKQFKMLNFFNLAKTLINVVKSKNESDENVKTADRSVFDNMEKKIRDIDETVAKDNTRTRADVYEEMRKRMEEVRIENEADPEIETADNSVFVDMQRQIEELQRKLGAQESGNQHVQDKEVPNVLNSNSISSVPRVADEMMAVTNSKGGSLALRVEPNMGAQEQQMRVPDNALIQILGFSENSIHLDGKESRFVFVDYNGTRGWLLESYLNRN